MSRPIGQKNRNGHASSRKNHSQRAGKKRTRRRPTARTWWFFVSLVLVVACILVVHRAMFGWEARRLLHVPYLDQSLEYPTGCESVTTVMALRYAGVDITVDEFIQNYLSQEDLVTENGVTYGPDPNDAFVGSPYEPDGFGCYARTIAVACRDIVIERNLTDFYVDNETGSDLQKLVIRYVDRDIPVILWASMEMKGVHPGKQWVIRETGETFTWKAGEHCLLLVGYDDLYYYFNDPRKNSGTVRYPKELVETCYGEMGKQAMVVRKEESETWWEEKLMQ